MKRKIFGGSAEGLHPVVAAARLALCDFFISSSSVRILLSKILFCAASELALLLKALFCKSDETFVIEPLLASCTKSCAVRPEKSAPCSPRRALSKFFEAVDFFSSVEACV